MIFKIIKIKKFKELKPEIDDTCGWLAHSYPLWLGKGHKLNEKLFPVHIPSIHTAWCAAFPFFFFFSGSYFELLGESARVFMKEPAKNHWFFDFFKVLKILQLHIKTGY